MQRVTKEDNQLLSKAELVQGHELDWLAVEISQRDNLDGQSTLKKGDTKLTVSLSVYCLSNVDMSLRSTQQAKPLPPWTMVSANRSQPSYQNLMNLRICLAVMAGHVPQHVIHTQSKLSKVPWDAEVSRVHNKAKKLAAALEQVANIFCKRNRERWITLNLLGSQFCRPPGITNGGCQNEKGFNIRLEPLKRHPTSKWTINHAEFEAILGLALWTLISDHRLSYCEVRSQLESSRAEDVPKKRIMSAGLDSRKINGELELVCWRGLLKVQEPGRFTFTRHSICEKMTLPPETNLDSYSLGSLWQVCKPGAVSEAPIKGLKERNWLDMPGDDVIPAQRLCGWSCVLGAHQNIQWTKQSLSEKALGRPNELPKTICVELSTTGSSLLDICTQELFGAFLAPLQMQGDDDDNCASVQTRHDVQRLEKRAETIKAISQIFVESGLGSDVDAVNCILPALDYRQMGDRDRVISIVSSTCDSFLERFEQAEALMVVNYAIDVLHPRETREEERSFAGALCMLSRIQRFEMCNNNGPKMHGYHVELYCKIWEEATERPIAGHLRLSTIEELQRVHLPLWGFRGAHGGERRAVYNALLEALEKKDRFDTMRSLCFLTRNGLDSLSAEESHSARAALPLAAKQGWFEAVDAMLSIGFDPPAQDGAGRTALGYCAEYGQFEHEVCAEIILSHGKALEALKCVSWSTDDGCTPLLLAIDKGHEEMVRILLKNGCAVNEQGGREFSPLGDILPLGDAISNGHEGVVRQLIDAGAALRPDHVDAAKYSNSPGIKQLIFGYLTLLVNESPDSWIGNLPDVIEHSDSKAVKVLLDRGAKYSFEHIALAVRRGQLDVKNLFLELVHSYVAEFPNHTREWLLKLAEEDDQDTLQALPDHSASVV